MLKIILIYLRYLSLIEIAYSKVLPSFCTWASLEFVALQFIALLTRILPCLLREILVGEIRFLFHTLFYLGSIIILRYLNSKNGVLFQFFVDTIKGNIDFVTFEHKLRSVVPVKIRVVKSRSWFESRINDRLKFWFKSIKPEWLDSKHVIQNLKFLIKIPY